MGEWSTFFGWFAGIALVAAMLPHQVRNIRILCLAAGLFGVLAFVFAQDWGLGLVLAAAFLIVNAIRFNELRARAREGTITSEERELFDHVMQIEDPGKQSRLRDLMTWSDEPVGETLIMQDQIDPPLIYIASGRAAIIRDDVIVSECGAGEFVGEMSQISGNLASATVKVTHPMRMARLDRDALAQLTQSLPEIGRAVDNAFNRSLAVKVMRMNESSRGASGAPSTAQQAAPET
ncbi:MAG: cyclic nucleotide-binding domain-containing protein [Erythrobacter sp.]